MEERLEEQERTPQGCRTGGKAKGREKKRNKIERAGRAAMAVWGMPRGLASLKGVAVANEEDKRA